MTKNTSNKTPINAITGTAPQPATTLPWPELPMDFNRDPRAVFCPILSVEPQLMIIFGYCMGN